VDECLAILKGLFLQAFFFALIFRDYPGYFTAFYEIIPDLYINAFFLSFSSRI